VFRFFIALEFFNYSMQKTGELMTQAEHSSLQRFAPRDDAISRAYGHMREEAVSIVSLLDARAAELFLP